MAIISESVHWVRWRVVLKDKDFNRLADLTSVLLIASLIYLFSQQSVHGLFTFLNWLPLLFFLLLTAQRYSSQGTIRLSSLFISLRKLEGKKGVPPSARLDMTYPYILVCLLSTSIYKTVWFFPVISLLVGYALWSIRPRRYSPIIWSFLLSFSITLAFFGQLGLHRLQLEMEELIISWFQWQYRDPFRQETAIGDIGQLKQSEEIVLRVKSPYPLLLRETIYNSYFKTVWRAKELQFQKLTTQEGLTWLLTKPPTQYTTTLQIARYLRRGEGLLALPQGTFLVDNLPVGEVQRNELGVVKVAQGPSLITYIPHFGHTALLDAPPTSQDLSLPPDEETLFLNLAHELALHTQTPSEVANTLIKFFDQNFSYSLNLKRSAIHLTPLADFLYQRRSGHCEYFATTTVLLLRAAGIPARYVSGYAVEEFSPLENLYLVRKRHAHAWTLAYLDGDWQEIDTTPATWFELETEQAPWWQAFYDVTAWARYQFVKWRQSETTSSHQWLLGLLVPLILFLVWRLYKKEKVRQARQPAKTISLNHEYPFYQVIQRLDTMGIGRAPHETLLQWFARLPLSIPVKAEIQNMLRLHQRQRFDPLGLNAEDYAILDKQVKRWLQSFKVDST